MDKSQRVTPAMEAKWRGEFDGNPSIQAEFGNEDRYVAFKRGVALGKLRVIAPGVRRNQ